MDEVWILSLCVILLSFFVFVFSMKSKPEPELESISKKASTTSASAYSSYGGKKLAVDEEEVEKMMARLTGLLYQAQEEKKKEDVPSPEKRKIASHEASEHETQDVADETQEPSGRSPTQAQSAYQLSRHRVQERSSPSAGVENIMDEIEQAVQETVEPEYYSRRRQQQAAARGRQWSDVTGRVEPDSN